MPIKPPRLEPGDTLGVCCPASAPPNPNAFDRFLTAIEDLGFKPKLARNARKRWGFLAGTDKERAADLMSLFGDRKVKGIICARGGYGSSRIVPLLDYDFIRSHAKILVGYSDITSLHCALLVKAGLVSFHGPMLNSDFIKPKVPKFTRDSFLSVLTQQTAPGSICRGYSGNTVAVLRKGSATGCLVGGNLTLLCATIGTDYEPPFEKSILFFEDLDEQPYRFDRMLTQLRNAGILQQCAGIAIGINRDCEDPKRKIAKEYRQSLEDVFRERLGDLRIPVVTGLPFGHIRTNATLAVGALAKIENGDLLLVEPAVRSVST